MQKYTLTLWTDGVIYTRGALKETLKRYEAKVTEMQAHGDADLTHVYDVAIRAMKDSIEEIDRVMPGLGRT